jgi:hypothetical protein
MNHRVWQFYFYVSKNWPDDEICLHFPGCTLTPNNHIYESFGCFCPLDSLDSIELIKSEDVLFDWSMPLYLNYTDVKIMDRIEGFLSTFGKVDRIEGEVFVCKKDNDCSELGELPSNEVVKFWTFLWSSYLLSIRFFDHFQEMRLLKEEDVKEIHDLYPASEIESIEVFEKLAQTLPGRKNNKVIET